MAQIGISSSPALELRAPFNDATLIPPLPPRPPELPHSFSYLLSMQDMVRHPPDSPACSSLSDHEFEFSEFASSPCSATEHDHSLVETISEDDRATLLPIIRIAFPSLRYSLKSPFTPWHAAAGDQIMGTVHEFRQPNDVEGLHHQSMDSEGSNPEKEVEVLQHHFIPTVPSTPGDVAHSTGVSGVQSREELKIKLAREVGGGINKVENLEVAEELMSLHRLETGTSNVTDDKLCLSIASGCGGLNLLTNFPSATNSWDHIEPEASRTGRVQLQAARLVQETGQFFHEKHFGSGPSSIDSGSPRLEITSSRCSGGADQSHASQSLGASQGQTCNESEHIISSDAEERATFGRRLDLACGSSRTNEVQKDSVTESRSASPAALSDVNNFKFPEVSRKRRNVIKKAVGWVRKTKTKESFCATSSYKRTCGSACEIGYEVVSKKRRFSANNPHEVSLSTLFSALPEGQSDKKSGQDKVARKVNSMTDLNSGSLEMDTGPVGKQSSCITPEWVDSLLATALFLVLLEAGSHGVSVCEALRKLLKQGYSKLFNSNSQPRAVQVKMALRGCPDFKELSSRRFALRNCRRNEAKKQSVELASDEQSKGAVGNCGRERGMPMEISCQKPEAMGGFSEELAPKSVTVSSTELKCHRQEENIKQCCKTDGKQWRCPHQVKLGFMYCEHHYQCQSRPRINSHFEENSHLDTRQKLSSSHTEEESQTVADSCSGQSMERSQGDEFKLYRCRRTDGRHWQCSKQAKPGSIYCEHHQGRRKKVKAKGNVPGLLKAPRIAKQELQVTEARAVDSTATGVKRNAHGNAHGQVRAVKELRRGLQGSDAFDLGMSPICWSGMVNANFNGQSAVLREMKLEKDLNDLKARRPQTGARMLKEKSNSICHGETKGLQTANQEIPGLNMGTISRHTTEMHGWEGRACHGQAAGMEQALRVAPDISHSVVDSCKWKMEFKLHGQITKDRDAIRDQGINASSLVRLSATSNVHFFSEKCADDEGIDGLHLERCHRKDGKQWQCSKHCKPGHIYCEHHLGRRLKNKANAQAKVVNLKELDSEASPTCKEGFSLFDRKTLHHLREQSQKGTSQMTDDCSQIGEVDLQGLKQCHRKDGKGWRCSHPVQAGFNYCEHHQESRQTSPPKVCK